MVLLMVAISAPPAVAKPVMPGEIASAGNDARAVRDVPLACEPSPVPPEVALFTRFTGRALRAPGFGAARSLLSLLLRLAGYCGTLVVCMCEADAAHSTLM